MKNTLLILFISTILFGCKQGQLEKTYNPRSLESGEGFNEFSKAKENVFTLSKIDSGGKVGDVFAVKYKDTTIAIQDKPKPLYNRFLAPSFLNSQKTAVLVQVADSSGMVSPFYIIALQKGIPEVIKLDRPSNGSNDRIVTKGLQQISLSTVLINNDYIITLINGKVYPVKRQNDTERIQGKFLLNSADRNTLVFATANSLYQTNYITGETYNLIVPEKILSSDEELRKVQYVYGWLTNSKGTAFLKDTNSDKVVDISEFKKK